jgi:hypothetical protein
LKQRLAGHLKPRAALAADAAQADAVRRLDADIEQVCSDLYVIERQLKATP